MFRDAVPRTSSSSAQMQSSLAAVLLHGEKGDELNTLYCTFENCSDVAKVRGRELCGKHYQSLHKAGLLPELGDCSESGCEKLSNFRGFCKKHRAVHFPQYFKPLANASKEVNVARDGARKKCSEVNCLNTAHCKGLCAKHYESSRRPIYESPNFDKSGNRKTCNASEGCDRKAVSKGFCYRHWERLNRHGSDVLPPSMEPCPVPGCPNERKKITPLCKTCNGYRHRYSLTVEEVVWWFQPANRVCGNEGCGSSEKLHMDHDHSCCPAGSLKGRVSSCGECVRGWLCASCNVSLGLLQENPRRIQGLLDYLATQNV